MSRPINRFRRWLVLSACIAIVALLLIGSLVWWMLNLEIQAGENGVVFIPPSATVVAAIDSVDARCKMPSAWLVKVTARVAARIRPLTVRSGWYLFKKNNTQLDVLEALVTGANRPTIRITLPEGLTKWEIASRLSRGLDVDSAAFVSAADSLEGRLFPNTYEFFWRENVADLVRTLTTEFKRQTALDPPTREQLILASIVQAEAASVQEMPRIAGVYTNRLRLGMKLEADPTVQYGLQSKERVRYHHLQSAHPWNTYQHNGLPPTPICNPGIDAIRAAQRPEQHEYLFFVARPDTSRLHSFSKNYSQHATRVQEYRRGKAAGRR